MAHTPSPWTIAQPWSGFSEIRGPNGELVFGLACGAEEEKQPNNVSAANARLVAAAPDLLSELKKITEKFEHCLVLSGSDAEFAAEAVAYSRLAIAKAEGGT